MLAPSSHFCMWTGCLVGWHALQQVSKLKNFGKWSSGIEHVKLRTGNLHEVLSCYA